MKVGILTIGWWTKDNYGALLQGFALQRTLQKLGCSVELIRYRCGYGSIALNFKRFIKRLLWGAPPFLHNRKFDVFRKKNMSFSKCEYRTERDIPQNYDAIICGSDQVWSNVLKMNGVVSKNWMLDFASESCKRISYAASFGKSSCNEPALNFIRPLLAKFHRVGVREYSGKIICGQAGRNDAQVVCDPTLLLSKEEYLDLVKDKVKYKTNTSFALCYLVGWKADIPFKEIKNVVQNNKLRFIHSHVVGHYYKGLNDEPLSIYEWLGAYSEAKYIFSNSFHGTVFAIIMHRPFICFPLEGVSASMNDRVKTLLCECGLENRLYNKDKSLEDQLNSPIDWNDVDARLSCMKNKAINFLTEALFG